MRSMAEVIYGFCDMGVEAELPQQEALDILEEELMAVEQSDPRIMQELVREYDMILIGQQGNFTRELIEKLEDYEYLYYYLCNGFTNITGEEV